MLSPSQLTYTLKLWCHWFTVHLSFFFTPFFIILSLIPYFFNFFLSSLQLSSSCPCFLSTIIHHYTSICHHSPSLIHPRPPAHQSIHSISLIDKQIFEVSPSWLGRTFPLKSSHGCTISLSLPMTFSAWHTPFRALCVSNYSPSSSTFIYILSSLTESEFITVTHLSKVLLLTEGDADGGWGVKGRVRTGSLVSCLIEGSCFWRSIYFKVKTVGIFTRRCLF